MVVIYLDNIPNIVYFVKKEKESDFTWLFTFRTLSNIYDGSFSPIKIIGEKSLIIYVKSSTIDVWQGPKRGSASYVDAGMRI